MSDIKVEEAEAQSKKKNKKLVLIPSILLIAGLGYGGYSMTAGKAEAVPPDGKTTTTIELGKVVRLQPITLNLSDGHVLKVGIAMQLVAKPTGHALAGGGGGGEEKKVDPESPLHGEEAKALDAAIQYLGNKTYAELLAPGGREIAKKELSKEVNKIYEHDVTEVFFTSFVMS